MKIVIFIILLSTLSWSESAEQTIREMDNVVKILDHKMSDNELFESLDMDIPKKNRSLPSGSEINEGIKNNTLVKIAIFGLFCGIITSIVVEK